MPKVIPVTITREPTLSPEELRELTHALGVMATSWSDYFKRYYDKVYNKAKTVFAPTHRPPAPPEPYAVPMPEPSAPPPEAIPAPYDPSIVELLNTVREINEKFQRLLEILPELQRPPSYEPQAQYAPEPSAPEPPTQERMLAFYRDRR